MKHAPRLYRYICTSMKLYETQFYINIYVKKLDMFLKYPVLGLKGGVPKLAKPYHGFSAKKAKLRI